jgi:WD40 repeat protein/tRNA A-37 threonylcarbamoyl transferase component Bud32
LPHGFAVDTVAFEETKRPSSVSQSLPRRFGDYEILEEIAHGGMGVVYCARQISLNRTVALKMIRTGEFASAAEVERFQSEAEAAAMLEHPHIVSIHEIGTQPGQQYFSMQMIEGCSLAQAMRRGEFIVKDKESSRRSTQLLATVARAVHYAHQRGILHRDLKPGNVLIDEQGQPFVTDFGLAKHVESDSTLTQSGHIVGTASYMSPEQASAVRKLTTATDVYSLGAILYELLTARPPHRGDSVLDTLVMVRQQEPTRPRAINPGVDLDLETICLKCLEKAPARRYGSAEALAEDLERWLHYEPIRARRSTVWERGEKWARRQPVIASMTALILLLIAVGFGSVTLLWKDAALARDTAEHAEKAKEQQRLAAVAEQGKAEQARDDEKEQRKKADDAKRQEEELRRKFQRLYIEQLLDKVADLNDKNEGARAALWLGHGLQLVSPEDADLARLLRTHLGDMKSQLGALTAMLPHQKTVRVAAFSGDGKRVLTGGDDGAACLWDSATGKLLTTLKHDHGVRCAAFIPKHKYLATGSHQAVQFWDADGKAVGQRLDHPHTVDKLAFSPDGKKLLSYCFDRAIRLWNIEDLNAVQLIGEMSNDTGQTAINALTFSPNSKLVAAVGAGGFVRLWDAETAKPFGPRLQQKDSVHAVLFCTDDVLVTGGKEGLKFYTVGTDELIAETKGLGRIVSLDYAPDLKLLAAGGTDGNGRTIWESGVLRHTLNHNDHVKATLFSRDGKRLLTGSADQTARLWDTSSPIPVGMPFSMPCPIYHVAFSPDGKTILAQGPDKVVRLWSTPGPGAFREPLLHDAGIFARATSLDGKHFVTGCENGIAHVWDVDTGELLGITDGHDKKKLNAAAFRHDGQVFVTGGEDRTARLWDGKTAKAIGKPCRHKSTVSLAAFRPDGKAFVTVAGRTAQLWDASSQEPLGKPMVSKRGILAVAFSPDSKALLTAGGDAGLEGEGARLWDATTGEPIGDNLKHPAEFIRAVAYSPDGRLAFTAGDDNFVRLWDTVTGELRGEPLPHNGPVEAAVFSHDSKTLLTASEDRTARLWDVATGKLRFPPILHPAAVQAVAFSSDDRLFATGGRDQVARIWDTASGKLIGTPRRTKTQVRLVSFSPDGRTLLVAGGSETRAVRLWSVPTQLAGDVERLVLWTQVLTGMEMNSEGVVTTLDAAQWQERRERLEKLGGVP